MKKYVEFELMANVEGAKIRQWRLAAGISQADFAARCGWSQQQQSKLESCYKRPLDMYDFTRIVEALNADK